MTHSYDPARGFPRVVPELVYEDVGAAIEWLSRVFGFRERLRHVGEDGRVGHADMELDGGIVMLAAGGASGRGSTHDRHACANVLVFVDDVDRHFEQAHVEGATIIDKPDTQPWGLRRYVTVDVEGHTWQFVQHVRDVQPEDWGAIRTQAMVLQPPA